MITKDLETTQKLHIDLFHDFDRWTIIHYYAFKQRNKYRNLFYHYFSASGIIDEIFSTEDMKELIHLIKKYGKNLNGMWGFLSLVFLNKNGISIYKAVNKSHFYNHLCSASCYQDGDPSFSKKIKVRKI
jgi:hypothetical protein